jgi:hypothetical protein
VRKEENSGMCIGREVVVGMGVTVAGVVVLVLGTDALGSGVMTSRSVWLRFTVAVGAEEENDDSFEERSWLLSLREGLPAEDEDSPWLE